MTQGLTLARARRTWPDVYIGMVAVAGIWAIARSLQDGLSHPLPLLGLVLVLLTLASGIAMLRMPSVAASFSISDAFTITAALAFGAGAGTLIVALDSLAISWRLARHALAGRRALFNATAPPLAMWIAAQLFFTGSGITPLSDAPVEAARLVVPAGLFTIAYFVLNTGLIAYAVAVTSQQPLLRIWREHFVGLWLSYFAGSLVAVVVVLLVYGDSPTISALVVLVPLPLALHAMFRSGLRRLEDQVGHLDKVNRLYQSTIETLAHAIDAKDQVTHGHIRRVQLYSRKLAAVCGLSEDDRRALEAAALLHDTGKLAIPEHILNKPARLTEAEFAVMRRHSEIGADILSTVDFPFPVVPIVRHHHESWDGTGYPDGLSGANIPVGARILSVVDCFDALTSDRPYRRRLSDDDALEVLIARRGTMYDPAIVDAFVEAQRTGMFREGETPDVPLFLPAVPPAPVPDAPQQSSPTGIYRALLDFATQLSAADTPSDLCALVHRCFGGAMPAATCVFYLCDQGTGELKARTVSGLHADLIEGWTIPLGGKLSGWVVANRRAIVNSDAALDLDALTTHRPAPLRQCLAVPLTTAGHAIGALTLYSTLEPFSDADAAVLEAVAERIAPALHATSTTERAASSTASPASPPDFAMRAVR